MSGAWWRGALSLVAGATLLGCSETPTRLIARVDSDLTPCTELKRVVVVAQRENGPEIGRRELDLCTQSLRLPGEVAIAPQDLADSRRVILSVEGSVQAAQGASYTLRQEFVVRFQRGRTMLVRYALSRVCAMDPCPTGYSCVPGASGEARCVSRENPVVAPQGDESLNDASVWDGALGIDAGDVVVDAADVAADTDVGDDIVDATGAPDVMDGPDLPNLPDIPDVPNVLDVPDVPDVLVGPDLPDIPDVPDVLDSGDVMDSGDVTEACDVRCQAWEVCSGGRCVNSTAVQFAPGRSYTCLLRQSGHVWCWGENASGQIGVSSPRSSLDPVRIPTISDAVAIEADGATNCARLRTGLAYCWGATRAWGGNGGGAPTEFTGFRDVVSVSSGAGHTCAVSAMGTARCGGSNVGGELGNGTLTATTSPVLVQNLTDAVEISVGGPGNTSAGHTCARRRDGSLWCWGSNEFGQLGTGTMPRSMVPVVVPGLTDVVEVALGTNHSCARRATGAVLCWGRNREGQIGDATREDRNTPTAIFGISDAVDIDANAGFSCAVRATGAVLCWGQNFNQQLGTNVSGRDATVPTVVAGITNAVHVAVGSEHACAIRRDGTLACWGKNDAGQVGDRTPSPSRPTPVTINVP